MADSDSSIAWHRARIKKLRAILLDFEAGRIAIGEIARLKTIRQTRDAVADLKRTIGQSEQIVEDYVRRNAKRPRGTDSQSLAGVRWS